MGTGAVGRQRDATDFGAMTFLFGMSNVVRHFAGWLIGLTLAVTASSVNGQANAPDPSAENWRDAPLVEGLDAARALRAAGEPVYRLSLEKERLREIPAEVFALEELRELVLNRNRLTSLDGEWGQVAGLVCLRASDNQIQAIPDPILRLERLEILDLGNNELERIPLDIDDLRALRELILWSNPIAHYPASLGNMRSLKRLDLMHNVMTAEEITAVKLWVRPEVDLILPAPCGCEIEAD